MRQLTQTVTATPENGWVGNCWQTCVACLLDLDPAVLPDQSKYDWRRARKDGSFEYGPSYHNPLQAYLREHHGLSYVEIQQPDTLLPFLRVADPGWHLMTGLTVRSASLGNRHVVVARYGEIVWDPHPSRAGLLDEINWAFLVPYPERWRKSAHLNPCVCPVCAA